MRSIGLVLILFSFFSYSQKEETKNRGEVSGQWRTYFMATKNDDDLKDYAALATGGFIKYVYNFGKGIEIGSAFYGSLNFGIQDLTIPDNTTGRTSRYEAGLFDVQNLDDDFIGFPGELFVSYTHKEHKIIIGRMKYKSPFLNPQDGRMIPTLEQGINYIFNKNKTKFQVGLFNRLAPRSTEGFSGISESIGLYPTGRHIDGSRSQYFNNTESGWIGTLNLEYKPRDNFKISLWDYYVDNLFNMVHIKPTWKISSTSTFMAEYLHQVRVGDGGNRIDSLSYFPEKSADIFGIKWIQKLRSGKISLSYNYIFDDGRFLFPREWGREFLFSFQKRERSEGSADNHAVVFYYDKLFSSEKNKWRTVFSVGHHWKASVTDPADNKYALPNYAHINLDIFWMPKKIEGLRPELLITHKRGTGEFPDNPNFILNKVDMWVVNFIVNYNF